MRQGRAGAASRAENCERLLLFANAARTSDVHQARAYAHRAVLLADASSLGRSAQDTEDLRARAHGSLGNVLRIAGDLSGATEQLEIAERHAIVGGSSFAATRSLVASFKGSLAHARHDYRGAIHEFASAFRIRKLEGDHVAAAAELRQIGSVLQSGGQAKLAAAVFESALAGATTAFELAVVLQNLASALTDCGDFAGAIDAILSIVSKPALLEALGPLGLIRLSWVKGRLAASTGATTGAREIMHQARSAFVEHGLYRDAALVTVDLAAVEHLAGSPIACRRECLKADRLLFGTGLAKAGFAVFILRQMSERQIVGAAFLAAVSGEAARQIRPGAGHAPPARPALRVTAAVAVDVAPLLIHRRKGPPLIGDAEGAENPGEQEHNLPPTTARP